MDASSGGHVAAHEHPGTTIQIDTEAEGFAEEPECCVILAMDVSTYRLVVAHGQYQEFIICLLWMSQQLDFCCTWTLLKLLKVMFVQYGCLNRFT